MNYASLSMEVLKHCNPREMERLQREGKLEETIKEAEEFFDDQEITMVLQMTKDLPEDLPFMERVQRMNQARDAAREIVIQNLTEFWKSIECDTEDPLEDEDNTEITTENAVEMLTDAMNNIDNALEDYRRYRENGGEPISDLEYWLLEKDNLV